MSIFKLSRRGKYLNFHQSSPRVIIWEPKGTSWTQLYQLILEVKLDGEEFAECDIHEIENNQIIKVYPPFEWRRVIRKMQADNLICAK